MVIVDEFVLHLPPCRRSVVCSPRHATLNDDVKKGLDATELEPGVFDQARWGYAFPIREWQVTGIEILLAAIHFPMAMLSRKLWILDRLPLTKSECSNNDWCYCHLNILQLKEYSLARFRYFLSFLISFIWTLWSDITGKSTSWYVRFFLLVTTKTWFGFGDMFLSQNPRELL